MSCPMCETLCILLLLLLFLTGIIGGYSLEHKERYDIIIVEEWYIFVLQVPRDFLPHHIYIFSTCLYFTL